MTGRSGMPWLGPGHLAGTAADLVGRNAIRHAWELGWCARLSCGVYFDVLRMPLTLGLRAVEILRDEGAAGPAVGREDAMDVLVPPGAVSLWPDAPAERVVFLSRGRSWACPSPKGTRPPAAPAVWLGARPGALTDTTDLLDAWTAGYDEQLDRSGRLFQEVADGGEFAVAPEPPA